MIWISVSIGEAAFRFADADRKTDYFGRFFTSLSHLDSRRLRSVERAVFREVELDQLDVAELRSLRAEPGVLLLDGT